jgi:Cof subfamily protein (haloacid dehalogenase superfamily)
VPPIQLIALDIDGTLLDSTFQVSARNLEALRRAHQAGVEIVLGTGRRHAFALPIAQALGFPVVLISSNGAVTKSSDAQLFHRDLLPAPVALAFVRFMSAYRHNMVLTFDRDGKGALIIESADALDQSIARWMKSNAPFIDTCVPLENSLTADDPIQAMMCGPIALMKQAEALLKTAPFTDRITVLKTQYEARDLCIVDILNAACSKGHALRRWAEHRGIPRDHIVAIGDNYNDLEMLEFAGLPFLMGNASDDLKQTGWPVTLGNDQSGVAAALEQVGI